MGSWFTDDFFFRWLILHLFYVRPIISSLQCRCPAPCGACLTQELQSFPSKCGSSVCAVRPLQKRVLPEQRLEFIHVVEGGVCEVCPWSCNFEWGFSLDLGLFRGVTWLNVNTDCAFIRRRKLSIGWPLCFMLYVKTRETHGVSSSKDYLFILSVPEEPSDRPGQRWVTPDRRCFCLSKKRGITGRRERLSTGRGTAGETFLSFSAKF